jgi:hypothetical protein
MFFPDAQSTGASRLPAPPVRWPFLQLATQLAQLGVRVPQILGEDCANGWLVVEDFGDITLERASQAQPERRVLLYQRAVSDLARAHDAFDEHCALDEHTVLQDCPALARSLDGPFLYSELQHFREYGLEARGILLSAAQRTRFDALSFALSDRIAAQRYGFSHRDYQSRNLMVLGDESESLGWIDFQDATLAPQSYDLVALLGDSYQHFDEAFVAARLKEYVALRRRVQLDVTALRSEFDRVLIQRKLKDAGRFVYIHQTKQDASYLAFVAPSLQRVAAALRRNSEDSTLSGLHQLLSELLPSSFA